MKHNMVYLIGAGPGNPSLITLRGKELIALADIIIYDALSSSEMLQWAKPTCMQINVGKRAKLHALPQADINKLLVSSASKAAVVVRLKGGDPFLFGRGGEEAQALYEASIPFEVVPGVTSAIAAPAYAGIPVTHRDYNAQMSIFSGHGRADSEESHLNLKTIAKCPGTKVMLMGMTHLGETMESLISHGQSSSTPAAAIQWATTGKQKTVVGTVKTLPAKVQKAGLGTPAVVVIGDVVSLRPKLNWYEQLPLFGKRIVITRTRNQASTLNQQLRSLGAEVIEMPTIKICPPTDKLAFAESVVHCHTYDWIIFSSPNGVDKFFEAFFAVFQDIRSLGGAKIAAVGPGTAAKLQARGLAVDLMPKNHVAEGLVDTLKKGKSDFGTIENSTFLWIRGEHARPVIKEGIFNLGGIVDECIAYRTEAETDDIYGAQADFAENGADVVTFTSASTVENFFQLNLPWNKGCLAASIGPITTQALIQQDIQPAIQAKDYDIPGLVSAIIRACKRRD